MRVLPWQLLTAWAAAVPASVDGIGRLTRTDFKPRYDHSIALLCTPSHVSRHHSLALDAVRSARRHLCLDGGLPARLVREKGQPRRRRVPRQRRQALCPAGCPQGETAVPTRRSGRERPARTGTARYFPHRGRRGRLHWNHRRARATCSREREECCYSRVTAELRTAR